MTVEITRTDNGDLTTIAIKGKLDVTNSDELRPFTEALVAEHRMQVTLDLAGLELIDSSGVAAIVGVKKRVEAYGGHVGVANVRDQPLAIFKLLRFDKVFDD